MKCNICGGEMKPGSSVCKYCGNIMQAEPEFGSKYSEYRKPTVRENITEPVPRKRELCPRCGRPLDETTGKCIACIREMNERRRSMEETDMAQKKRNNKKEENNARTVIIMIVVLVVLFLVAIRIALAFAGKWGIGGLSDKNEVTPTPQVAVSTTHPTTHTLAPERTQLPTPTPSRKPVSTPVPQESGDPVKLRGGEYEYESNTHLITVQELQEMEREDIKHIYWEIYARHGYTFDGELADYFENNHSWYVPTTTDIAKVEASFNDIEKRNLSIIYDYQRNMGWR